MSGSRLRAAIVGLGQVGMGFDEEPARKASGEVWTHFSAYGRLPQSYDLIAATDPDPAKRAAAVARKPGLAVFDSVEAMLDAAAPDVVSVCTPDATHLAVGRALAGRTLALFMEKPLSGPGQAREARELADRFKDAGMSVRVNYYKRHEPLFGELRRRLGDETPLNVCVRYSGPFDAVGSHALNLAQALAPGLEMVRSWRTGHAEGDGYSAYFTSDGPTAQVLYCGPRHRLIFELEAVAPSGRYVLEENLSLLRVHEYDPSDRYQGYEELRQADEIRAGANTERFVSALREIAGELAGGDRDWAGLDHAVHTQSLMERMQAQAMEDTR